MTGKKNIRCFNCDQIGHYKNQCKEPTKDGKGKVFALELATSGQTVQEKGKVVLGGTLQIHGMCDDPEFWQYYFNKYLIHLKKMQAFIL